MLMQHVQENTGDSEATLALLKVAWHKWLKEWFHDNPGKFDTVQRFVYDKLRRGMKTYDELSGVELLLRRGLGPDAYTDVCASFGIQVLTNVSSNSPPFLGGGTWDGTQIKFNEEKRKSFHEANVALIRGQKIFPETRSDRTETCLCVITDPRTDPTEDDAACLMALVNGNKQLAIWNKIHVVVTGCTNSLDARYSGIQKLIEIGEGVVTIEVAPVIPTEGTQRFMAPYGGTDGEIDHTLEEEALSAGKHVISCIPADTSDLLVIGQVPGDFFKRLVSEELRVLKGVSIQGPGFNLMGVQGQDNVGKQILQFRTKKPDIEFYWSDNTSGLMILPTEADERIVALGECLNDKIPLMRSACITSFWATAGRFKQFESQFEGYKYGDDTLDLLQKLFVSP